jgi:hypothetical protein
MGKKNKKFQEEENMGDAPAAIDIPEEAVTEEPAAPEPEAPKEPREITALNIVSAIKELGGKANVSAIRKRLGQPSIPPDPHKWWAGWIIRHKAKVLVDAGVLRLVNEKRIQVYEVVDESKMPLEEPEVLPVAQRTVAQ